MTILYLEELKQAKGGDISFQNQTDEIDLKREDYHRIDMS